MFKGVSENRTPLFPLSQVVLPLKPIASVVIRYIQTGTQTDIFYRQHKFQKQLP
jgi:hypothetical protein